MKALRNRFQENEETELKEELKNFSSKYTSDSSCALHMLINSQILKNSSFICWLKFDRKSRYLYRFKQKTEKY